MANGTDYAEKYRPACIIQITLWDCRAYLRVGVFEAVPLCPGAVRINILKRIHWIKVTEAFSSGPPVWLGLSMCLGLIVPEGKSSAIRRHAIWDLWRDQLLSGLVRQGEGNSEVWRVWHKEEDDR
ncbi:unnamed protein product [Protopolystoma xenopodis]|uniref:Uncharacterized protein n=1 Tax=Protopolystoma xenopodis TaxID=117903 RepID=A0A3S5FH23_9PLAT|nr:unnamed protein product [Protopolystoma xenopodis]